MHVKFFQNNGQMDTEAVCAGVYRVELHITGDSYNDKLTLYIGESYSMTARCGYHLFKVFQHPEYFGLLQDDLKNEELTLSFNVAEPMPGSSKIQRKEMELECIRTNQPLTQHSSNDKQLDDRVKVVQYAINGILHKELSYAT